MKTKVANFNCSTCCNWNAVHTNTTQIFIRAAKNRIPLPFTVYSLLPLVTAVVPCSIYVMLHNYIYFEVCYLLYTDITCTVYGVFGSLIFCSSDHEMSLPTFLVQCQHFFWLREYNS